MTEVLKSALFQAANAVEKELARIIDGYRSSELYTDELSKVVESAEYSLMAGGKRLRPFLVFEFCRLCGGTVNNALASAAAIEMVHTYSLIHDDLPCMDNDDYRRGKLTNHKVFGEATATLGGDALLTEAFSVIAKSPLDDKAKVDTIRTLSEKAGILGMIGGQEIDLKSEGSVISLETLRQLQRKKTGMLFEASCLMGCIASGKESELKLKCASEFSHAFGLAFQITDDILDVIGNSEELGKSIGSDEKDDKYTFVTHLGVEGAALEAKKQINAAKDALIKAFGSDDTSALCELCDYLLVRRS